MAANQTGPAAAEKRPLGAPDRPAGRRKPRQTCNSGSQPDSRTAHSEKYVTARHTLPARRPAAQRLQHGQEQAEKLLARLRGGQQLLATSAK